MLRPTAAGVGRAPSGARTVPAARRPARPRSWRSRDRTPPTRRRSSTRFAAMLDPGRHALVRLAATLPAPLALFEHEAQLNALLLRDVAARGVDQVGGPDAAATRRSIASPSRPASAGSRAAPGTISRRRSRAAAVPPSSRSAPPSSTVRTCPSPPTPSSPTRSRSACARASATPLRCPTLPVGCAAEHLAFPGTLSLEPATLEATVTRRGALTRAARRRGGSFVFSAHGGNVAALRAMHRRWRRRAPASSSTSARTWTA